MSDPFVGPTNTGTVVVPTQWQTDRQDVHSAILAMLAAFMAAYPGYIRTVHHALPASLTGEGPFLYIGDIRESLLHSGQVDQRVFRGQLAYVDTISDPEEVDDRVNVLSDALTQLLIVNARMLPQGYFAQTDLDDSTELDQGPVRMTNVVLSWMFVVNRGGRGGPP